MDPLAHTLAGATLGETGLKRTTALGGLTLMIGANLPDIDGVAMLWGRDAGLMHRRGWTHGVVAMVVLPVVLTGVMHFIGKRRALRTETAPPDFKFLLLLSALSVWSHPFLDWLNQYGVRLLMPFSGAWFYGDALFIIDPWLWLMGGCAVALAHSSNRKTGIAWLVLLAIAVAIVTQSKQAPAEAKMIWCIGAGLMVFLRFRSVRPNPRHTAIVATATIVMYIGTMLMGTRLAETQARRYLESQGLVAEAVAAMPLPAQPFSRDVVARIGNQYHFFTLRWAFSPHIKVSHPPIPMGERSAVIQAALADPAIAGAANWLRYPAFEETETDFGYRVTIRDVRYSRSGISSIGVVSVDLNRRLEPIVYPD